MSNVYPCNVCESCWNWGVNWWIVRLGDKYKFLPGFLSIGPTAVIIIVLITGP